MSERPLIELIVQAFRNLGGRARLGEVYEEVHRLGYAAGSSDPNKIIRSAIQKHSSDSRRFSRNPDHDLFRHAEQQRSGIWELRDRSTHRQQPLTDEEGDRGEARTDDDYVPLGGDQREVVERQIRQRRGQQKFRNALRERYGDKCLVTGCEVLAVLEAAHLKPYRREEDNHPANGVLLRADIHTVFDLDLLGIKPATMRIELHPDIVKEYGRFANAHLRCNGEQRPAREALNWRYEEFRKRLQGRP